MSHTERATIRDVARAAGVSPTTVSHALNGKGVVKAETVERITRIAHDLGYRPSALARGLRHPEIGLIGMIIRPFDALESFMPPGVDYFLRIAGFAALTAMEHGYGLMIHSSPSAKNSPVSASVADVYVVAEPYENDAVLSYLERERIPFVTIGADIGRPHEFVTVDTTVAGTVAEGLDYLRARGAERIALLTGVDRNEWNLTSQATYEAWALAHEMPTISAAIAENIGDRAGELALDALTAQNGGELPDAIYCLMGRHASGVARTAVARGIDIPGRLQLIADSESVHNQTESPTISAYDLQPELLAATAVETAIAHLRGTLRDRFVPGPRPRFHARESTRPAREL